MGKSFRECLDSFLDSWRASSITDLKELISKDYMGREIRNDEVDDFKYEESIKGWEQGFKFITENHAEWDLKEIAIMPLKEDENLVVLSASILKQGESIGTSNIFFETFKRDIEGNWKLVRSYIVTGVINDNLSRIQFS